MYQTLRNHISILPDCIKTLLKCIRTLLKVSPINFVLKVMVVLGSS